MKDIAIDDALRGEVLPGRVELIIIHEQKADQLTADADQLIGEADAHRWEAARLIAAELAAGKSQVQLAKEIGKTRTHVQYMAKAWTCNLGCTRAERPNFNKAYQAVKLPRAEPQPQAEPDEDYRPVCEACGNHWDPPPDEAGGGYTICPSCDTERATTWHPEDEDEDENPDTAPEPTPVRSRPAMLTLHDHTGKEWPYPQPQAKPAFNLTEGDGISWAAWSWNPVTGCLHGCNYCYARAIAHRFPDTYPAAFTPLFHHERLDAPANTVIPAAHRDDPAWRRVFVCSMADLYGRWVPDKWIKQVHAAMLANPQWQYILLTKFPARYTRLQLPPGAWVGTSVDEQKRVRIAENAFRQISGAAVKWLSLEPLLEPLRFSDLSMFDWVVIGGQTETRQPDGTVPAQDPPSREYVMELTLQAKQAGCAVHWKPNIRKFMWFDEYPGGPLSGENRHDDSGDLRQARGGLRG